MKPRSVKNSASSGLEEGRIRRGRDRLEVLWGWDDKYSCVRAMSKLGY